MSKIRIYGDTSGYVDLTAPAVADNSSLSIGDLATNSDVSSAIDTAQTYTDQQSSFKLLSDTKISTSQSTLSFDNVFDPSYNMYKLFFNVDSGTAAADIRMRFRISGSDVSDSKYLFNTIRVESGSVSGISGANLTYARVGVIQTNVPNTTEVIMDITMGIGRLKCIGQYLGTSSATSSTQHGTFAGSYWANNRMDGITFYPSTGNISGQLRVYGYGNAGV